MRNVYVLERSEDYTIVCSNFKKAEKFALEYVGELKDHRRAGQVLAFYYGEECSATITKEMVW